VGGAQDSPGVNVKIKSLKSKIKMTGKSAKFTLTLTLSRQGRGSIFKF
jgi:hypothetical protein